MAKVSAADVEIQDGPTLYPVISEDNLLLFLWVCVVIWFNCTYQKFALSVYSTESFHFFDHVIKILLNYFNFWHLERSLPRNIIFNTLRCMPDEFIVYAVHGNIDSLDLMLYRLVSVWVLTAAV